MPKYKPLHPGVFILNECMKPLNLDICETSTALNILPSSLNALVYNNDTVTPDIAIRLSKVFGSTPEWWLRMQNEFDLNKLIKNKEYKELKKYE